jgi:hypothetical protein
MFGRMNQIKDAVMRLLSFMLTVIAITYWAPHAHSEESKTIPLKVLYLGREKDEQRSNAFAKFLSAKFVGCTAAKRDEFKPQMLEGVDVVLLDWSQQERSSTKYESPFGPIENWKTPTVLLGSAGLILAGPWSIIGGAG